MKTKTIKLGVIALSACLFSSPGFSQNTCSFVSEQYGSAAAWTTVHPATFCPGPAVTISNGAFNYNACSGAEENRMYRNISFLANSWIADFDFFINTTATYSPYEVLAGFTAGAQDAYNTVVTPCNGGSFPATNQDAIIAAITSAPNNTGWGFQAGSKDGNAAWSMSAAIPCPQTTATYYIRLQRLDQTHGLISVFTDAARTVHLAGSPQCFTIVGNITNINTLQHGNVPQGAQTRTLNGSIDNMCISKQSPLISGPGTAGCYPSCPQYLSTYSVTGVVGATYTASSWTLPPGAINVSYSPDFSSVSFTFVCTGPAYQQVKCNPSFGTGTPCTIALIKSVSLNLCKTSGIVENEADQSDNLYPNPNNGTFTLSYHVPEGSKAHFEISDLSGRKISSYELKAGTNSLEVHQNTLEQGVYFYSIVQDGQLIKTEKFSVIR